MNAPIAQAATEVAPITQAASKVATAPGCAFLFFWGLEILKCINKNSDFGWVRI
jgi:hypothetical protein